jgi:hypothetical protein
LEVGSDRQPGVGNRYRGLAQRTLDELADMGVFGLDLSFAIGASKIEHFFLSSSFNIRSGMVE